MATISVIIPAYNAERTILETIKSVQEQIFSDFELIVINDGSKDRTEEIVQGIKDDRIKIFAYENGGLATARNRGISHATGEFIAFLDADDLWTPDKLELQLALLKQHPEAGVAYSWTCFMDVDKQEKISLFLPSSCDTFAGNVYQRLLLSNFIHSGSNTLVRREAIESVGGFDPACASSADWDYWLRLSKNWSFEVVPKPQILYRRASGSMSSKVELMRKEGLIALEKAYQAAPPELQYLKSHTLANLHHYYASLYVQHSSDPKDISQAGKDLRLAIQTKPQILLDSTTQKLLIKFLFKRFFPGKLANDLVELFRKPVALEDPRLHYQEFVGSWMFSYINSNLQKP